MKYPIKVTENKKVTVCSGIINIESIKNRKIRGK
jgi:hypothetical protein